MLPGNASATLASSVNPAHPDQVVGTHAVQTEADVTAAVNAAKSAQPDWAALGHIARGTVLRRAAHELEERAEELGRLLTVEEGKTLGEGIAEVRKAAQTLHFHAAQGWAPIGETYASSGAEEEIRTHRVPVGVVAVITPWNFPVAVPTWKLAPALQWGNAVVWKSASNVPVLSQELEAILQRAGLPAGVLNLVLGPGYLGQALTDSDVDAITFTGSTEVGRAIWDSATPRGVKVQMELGGHNAAIVFDDADLELAATHVVDGAMLSTGQKCTATRRAIVHESVYEPFLAAVVRRVSELSVGDGLTEVDVGPLVSAGALDEVCEAVEEARRAGADVRAGGAPLDTPDLSGGYYFQPTVLTGVRSDMRIAQEEVFGPVLSVLVARSDDEAIALANSTRYGLSAAAFTVDERRIRRVVEEVDAGLIHINNPTPGSEPHVPFGGMRASSTQASPEQGTTARDFFTHLRSVYERPGSARR